jgi:CheY-like chemotaxis protein
MSDVRAIVALEPKPGSIGADLVARGVVVGSLYSPDDVVELLDTGSFDLCVIFAVDPRTPEVLRQLRASPAGAVMPVLIVGGADTDVADRERALDLGADAFIDQTEGDEEVLARVEMLLGRPSVEPPQPASQIDPVEEALATAEAVAPVPREDKAASEPVKVAVGEASVQQIIDRIETQISTSPPMPPGAVDGSDHSLDGLDIEADLGRPATADSAPAVPATPAARNRGDEALDIGGDDPLAAGNGETSAGDAERELTPGYEREDEDEPTLPGTPAGVAATIGEGEPGRAPVDDADDESTLIDVPAEEPLDAFALDTEANETALEPRGPMTRLDRGSLEHDALWSLLALALAERASGALVLNNQGVERKVFVDNGQPVMAVSSARDDRLIELLHREGRLSEEQHEQAAMTIGASGRRAGVILMEKGLISPRELFPLVRHHYETLIFDSFTWREGGWSFDPAQRAEGERILLDVPAGALIVEGIRLRASAADVDGMIPAGSRPVRTELGICALDEIGLPPEDLVLLEACDGTRSTHELARRAAVPDEEVRTLLAGLIVLGWVRESAGAGDSRVEDAPVIAEKALPGDERVERARVADKLSQVEEGTYFAIMELSPAASGYEIRKAYRRLRGQFAPERFAVAELVDLQPDVKVIRFVLDEAYEVLRNPALREAYRQAIGAGA